VVRDETAESRLKNCEKATSLIVGFDRNVNYYKIQYATLCIRQGGGCLFATIFMRLVMCTLRTRAHVVIWTIRTALTFLSRLNSQMFQKRGLSPPL
jgi:hypothetical protein